MPASPAAQVLQRLIRHAPLLTAQQTVIQHIYALLGLLASSVIKESSKVGVSPVTPATPECIRFSQATC